MDATLIHKGWLQRTFAVSTPDGSYTVAYSGRGAGYETISVNNEIVAGESSNTWFIPKFDFKLGTNPAVLHVRVWPWLAVRSLSLSVLYDEGDRQPQVGSLIADDTQTGEQSRLETLGLGWHIADQSLVALLVLPSLFVIIRQVVRAGIESFGVTAPWDWPALIALVVGLLLAWGWFASIIYAGQHTTMTTEGIRQQRLFRRERYFTWGEVSEWSRRSRMLVLKGARGQITVNLFSFRRPDAAAEYALAHLQRARTGDGRE